ncbi:MAG: RNA polymerase sigma factor [Parahaliea sp.]
MNREWERARDGRLVKRGQQGDAEALGELVELYHGVIYRMAFRMLGDVDDAADVTQITFVRAFEKLHSFRSEHVFFSWLYRIGINQAADWKRRPHDVHGTDDCLMAQGGDPQSALHQAQIQDQVQNTVMQLSDEHRAVIVLRHFSECSYDEISEILSIPEKTVKSRLFEARCRLRDLFEGGMGRVE